MKMVQRSYTYLRLLILSLLLLATNLQAQEAERTLIACGHPFYPPVSWVDHNQLVGVAPKATQILFGELGYKVHMRADSNWKRCLREVEQGNADIVVAAYRIESRERYLHFTKQHIISDPVTLFVHQDNANQFNQLEDLKGKTVGLLLGDSFGDTFDDYIRNNSKIEYVSSGQQNFGKLALERIDYMPLGRLSGRLQSEKLGFHQQIVPLNWVITTEFYYLAVGHHSKLSKHLPALNRRLSQMHREGTISRLTDQFSQHYLQQAEQP